MCDNKFLEEDGYCVRCGEKHKSTPKRQNVMTYADLIAKRKAEKEKNQENK